MLVKEKVKQAIELLNEFNIDCWLTFVRESSINGDPTLSFLTTSHVTWHSAFIISRDGKAHAIVGQYDKLSVEETDAYDEVVPYVTGIKEPLLNYLKQLNPSQIAINFSKASEICDGITYGMYLTLKEYLSEIGFENRLMSSEKIISALRERKSQEEIDRLKNAINCTEDIFKKVSKFIKPGVTEKEIAAFMKKKVEAGKMGFAWEEASCPAVFTGPDTAMAHYTPTDRVVERGHVLNMDFGVKINDYVSDMQRSFYILKENETEAPDDVKKGFETIKTSIEMAKKAIKPGMQGYEIDAITRNYIVQNGYSEFPHALGHQVGRFAHDGTAILGPKWEKYAGKPMLPLEEGMVFTIEPRLTVEGKGVVTIEEMVVVTKDGCEWLSHPQKKLILI